MKPTQILLGAPALIAFVAVAACAVEEAPAAQGKALSCVASEGGAVTAANAWMREQADENGMSAAYFVLCNGTTAPVTLTGLETGVAGYAEFHETARDDRGVVSMAPMSELTLAPGEAVRFEPGGKHAMLMELNGPIEAERETPLVLRFEDGSTVAVTAVSRSAVEAASDHEGN